MSSVAELYLATLQGLEKAIGSKAPRGLSRQINAVLDDVEPKLLSVLLDWLKGYRTRLKRRMSTRLAKSDSDDIRADVLAALGNPADDVVNALAPVIEQIVTSLASVKVTVNWNLVNQTVQHYLRENAESYFSDFADNEAAGIQSAIADAMSADKGYTIKTIAKKILSLPVVYTKDKTLPTTTWAASVARTETARAAAYAQREALQNAGLKTWQWFVQSSGCDECQMNDQQIVVIGEPFASGATESPQHVNCRCVQVPVQAEILSL